MQVYSNIRNINVSRVVITRCSAIAETALQGALIVFAKSRRLELRDNIVIVDTIGLSSTAVI